LKGSGFRVQPSRWPVGAQFDRERKFLVSVKNSKSQVTHNKQITMTTIPNNKPVWVIGY
jgi:hypothetical protein